MDKVTDQKLVVKWPNRNTRNAGVDNAVLNHVAGIHDGESGVRERVVTRK